MSTPIGHSLLGIAFCRVIGRPSVTPNWRWYFFGIIAANAPDLDFLAGALQGDINLYHQGPSHSILAAILFGCAAAITLPRWLSCRPAFLLPAGTLIYASHLLLDYFRADNREPFGMPLLWPISDQHWISSLQFFHGIKHGVPGDSLPEFIGQLFSYANLLAVGTEIIILLPIAFISILTTRNKWLFQYPRHSA